MARGSGNSIQLDWFNVTYRSVFAGVTLVVLAAGGAGAYWYVFHIHRPRVAAVEAIDRAEGRFREATGLGGEEERIAEVLASAQIALGEAHGALGSMRFDEARGAALRAENLSSRVIGMIRGAEEGDHKVRFYRLEGDVRVKRSGEFSWEQADAQMELRLGDQVKTSSSGSAQLIYFDGTITSVQPGSLLEIRELYEHPVTKVRRVRESLEFGELEASTQERNVEGSFHEVATADVAARSDEASEFRVTAKEGTGKAAFDVFQGQIEVASESRREAVVAGERIDADRGKLGEKDVLPGVPVLVSPRDQKVYMLDDQQKDSIVLNWEPVAGAESYHLVISDRTLFTDPLYDARRGGTQAELGAVPEGAYHWKVAAVNAAGLAGPFSAVRRFRVSSQRVRDRSDTQPPSLDISEFVPIGLMVIVNGRTEPGAALWVGDEKIDVYDDGTFYAVVRLKSEGLNELRFVAQDTAGNETELKRSTFVELY